MSNRVKTVSKIIFVIALNLFVFIAWKGTYETVGNFAKQGLLYTFYGNYGFISSSVIDGYNTDVQRHIDILYYDMSFDLYPEKKLLEGNVTLKGLIKSPAIQKINLNFQDNFNIKLIELNGKKISDFHFERSIISIPFHNHEKDTFELKFIYEGTPKNKGLSSFSFGEFSGRSFVYTLSEPIYASTWFPCNDMPDDKALMEIRITNDSSKISLSNGNLVEVLTEKTRRTYHWKTVYPISTYLICLYSGDYKYFSDEYKSISGENIKLDYYAFPEHLEMAKADYKEHPEMMHVFEEKFGAYPFQKEKYGVAEFLWQGGAMEHQTMTGIASNLLNGKRMFQDYYIHELAHQWWGDAVGPKTWKDIWLNEGFATYCEALYAEAESGKDAYKSTMAAKFQNNFKGKLYDPDNLFSSTVYDKGAWVLHMLRFELGEDIFSKLLKEFYNRFKYNNASTFDFKSLCEEISGKNLDQFFDQWVYNGEGIIKINYDWKETTESNSVKLDIKQVQDEYLEYKFPLEIKIKYNDGSEEIRKEFVGSRNAKFNLSINKQVKEVSLDPDNWVLATFTKSNSGK